MRPHPIIKNRAISGRCNPRLFVLLNAMGRVEMEVVTVHRDPFGSEGAFLLILHEKMGNRRLKIIIADAEARAINMELEKYTFRRPLTHDLLVNIVHALEARVLELTIHKLEDNTFFAYLLLEAANGQVIEIDCRPSDGVAIALKTHAPIYCEETVLEIAGTPIEEPEEKGEEEEKSLDRELRSRFQKEPENPFLERLLSLFDPSDPRFPELILQKWGFLSDREEVLEFLEKQLNKAIQEENYELAAKLRDLIQRLSNM